MTYYLGMDAGGTKTYAIITDEDGKVCGVGRSGNGNHQTDRRGAEDNILSATNEALITAGLTVNDITFAWFGIAGGDREIDFLIIRSILEKLELPRYDVSGDTMIALRAGTTRPNGVVVICGTGVNCAGRNIAKEFFQCGGFGYNYGDYGGGGWLSVEVFRAVIRQWEGRSEETLLTELVLDKLHYESVEAMFHDFLNKHLTIPNELTQLLFPAYKRGDQVARAILKQQGIESGLSIQAVVRRLNMEAEVFDVVLAGSVVTRTGDNIIHEEIRRHTKEIAPKANVISLNVEPVVGAILLAMESAGEKVNPAVYEELIRSTNIMFNRIENN